MVDSGYLRSMLFSSTVGYALFSSEFESDKSSLLKGMYLGKFWALNDSFEVKLCVVRKI